VAGVALGIAPVGGLAAGLYAFGGAAFGWVAAVDGPAVARDWAVGGSANAVHANDPVALQYFRSNVYFQAVDWGCGIDGLSRLSFCRSSCSARCDAVHGPLAAILSAGKARTFRTSSKASRMRPTGGDS
jgi:hypothetical protein